jgi:hypothetical protein
MMTRATAGLWANDLLTHRAKRSATEPHNSHSPQPVWRTMPHLTDSQVRLNMVAAVLIIRRSWVRAPAAPLLFAQVRGPIAHADPPSDTLEGLR